MEAKRHLSTQECTKILTLKKKGLSIHAISREINRTRCIITKFVKNPEEYIKKIQFNKKSYEKLNNSLDKTLKKKKKNDKSGIQITPLKKSPTKLITSTPNNKKIIRKNNDSSKKYSDDDIKRFNRVSVEYRAVIKYLIKKGIGPRFVYEDMKKVYGSNNTPDLQSVLYWAKQYQHGRQTIVNEPANKQQQNNSSKIIKSNSASKNQHHITNTSKSMTLSSSTSPSKQVKLFKFKFQPVKRLNK